MLPQLVPTLREPALSSFDAEWSHAVFYEEIARRDASGRPWHSVACGLTVLRLLEGWADGQSLKDWGLAAVTQDVDQLERESPLALSLRALLDCAITAGESDFAAVTPRLTAYARELECSGDWLLAVDVYRTILSRLPATTPIVVACHIRLGYCYRNLNWLSLAEATFEQTRQASAQIGNTDGSLRAEVGHAQVAIMRGNYPAGEAQLRSVLARAQGPELSELRAKALHGLATIANRRGDDVAAVAIAFDALSLACDEIDRDRLIADIGYTFLQLKMYDAARDACLTTALCAREHVVRCAGYLNLMEIASCTGNRADFDAAAEIISTTQLSIEFTAYYHLILATGLLRFGEKQRAQEHLRRAHAIAVEHDVNWCIVEVEELLLTGHLEPRARVRPLSASESERLAEIAAAMRTLRAIINV